MSTVRTNNVQVGQSLTATNNFTLYQPTVPDGTVRLGVGNTGATTLDAVTVNNAGNVSVPSLTVNSNNISSVNSLGFRNRIINGGMVIDQRNNGASISFPGGDGNYCLDRWRLQRQGSGTMTVQQVTSAPAGFSNAIRFTVTGTSTPSAGDFYTFGQIIEGFNTADLAWGTASAQTVTLSFWINSSVTGTYSASLYNVGSVNGYPATFTVNAANTWEYKTITIPGATAGTWATGNTGSIYFRIDLGSGSIYNGTPNAWNTSGQIRTSGSVNFISNSGATLTMTGAQLEAGNVATPFERRDYGTELIRCQRYFQTFTEPRLRGVASAGNVLNRMGMPLLTTMRTAPTCTLTGTMNWYDGSTIGAITSIQAQYSTISSIEFDFPTASGTSAATRPVVVYVNANNGVITASSEL